MGNDGAVVDAAVGSATQAEKPPALHCPAPHDKQADDDVEPVLGLYVPEAQAVHEPAPVELQ